MSDMQSNLKFSGREDFLTECDLSIDSFPAICVVVVIDAEDLRQIQNLFGYEAFTVVRRNIAGRLKAGLPTLGFVSFLGEDRLVVKFLAENENEGKVHSERLHRMLESSFDLDSGETVDFVFNLGVAMSACKKIDLSQKEKRKWSTSLLASAEIAMLNARKDPSLGLCFSSENEVKLISRRIEVERLLSGSAPVEEMHLEYQPIVELESGTIIAQEALLRWNNDFLGEVEPYLLLELLTDSRPALNLARWTLDELLKNSVQIVSVTNLNINISPELLFSRDRRLLDYLVNDISNANRKNYPISLEFSPRILAWSKKRILQVANELDEAGYGLILDDVTPRELGSLFLSELPIKELKISRKVTSMIFKHNSFAKILEAFSSLQNARLVAKGVEDKNMSNALLNMGILYGQGYYLGKPKRL